MPRSTSVRDPRETHPRDAGGSAWALPKFLDAVEFQGRHRVVSAKLLGGESGVVEPASQSRPSRSRRTSPAGGLDVAGSRRKASTSRRRSVSVTSAARATSDDSPPPQATDVSVRALQGTTSIAVTGYVPDAIGAAMSRQWNVLSAAEARSVPGRCRTGHLCALAAVASTTGTLVLGPTAGVLAALGAGVVRQRRACRRRWRRLSGSPASPPPCAECRVDARPRGGVRPECARESARESGGRAARPGPDPAGSTPKDAQPFP